MLYLEYKGKKGSECGYNNYEVAGIQPRAPCILGKYSNSNLQPQTCNLYIFHYIHEEQCLSLWDTPFGTLSLII